MVDFKIAIVESDESYREVMQAAIGEIFQLSFYNDGAALLAALEENPKDLVIINFAVSDMSAIDLQQEVNKNFPTIETVMLTSIDRSKCMIESMKKRALDYIYQTDDEERFRADVCKLVRHLIDDKKRRFTENALKETGLYQLIQDVYENRSVDIEEIKKEVEKLKQLKKK